MLDSGKGSLFCSPGKKMMSNRGVAPLSAHADGFLTAALWYSHQVVKHSHECFVLLLPKLPFGMCGGAVTSWLRDPWTCLVFPRVQHHHIIWPSSTGQRAHLQDRGVEGIQKKKLRMDRKYRWTIKWGCDDTQN